MNRQYPCLEVHLDRLTHNAQEILSRCRAQNIQVCGIIKGCGGMPQVAQVMRQNGAAQIGTSRLEQVARCRAAGVDGPFLLIRIPGLTELPDTVALCDLSLQSDRTTLDALEQECRRQNRNDCSGPSAESHALFLLLDSEIAVDNHKRHEVRSLHTVPILQKARRGRKTYKSFPLML